MHIVFTLKDIIILIFFVLIALWILFLLGVYAIARVLYMIKQNEER